MRFVLTGAVIFTISASALGAEPKCWDKTGKFDIDRRKEYGPMRNQDGIGWCYAYAMADMYSHYLFRKNYGPDTRNKEDMISAASAAIVASRPKREASIASYRAYLLESSRIQGEIDEARAALNKVVDGMPTFAALRARAQNPRNPNRVADAETYSRRLSSSLGLAAFTSKIQTLETARGVLVAAWGFGDGYKMPGGGWATEVLKQFATLPICRERELRSDDFDFSDSLSHTARPPNLNDILVKSIINPSLLKSDPSTLGPSCQLAKKVFPGFRGNLEDMAKVINQSTDPIEDLRKQSCKAEIVPETMEPEVESIDYKQYSGKNINEARTKMTAKLIAEIENGNEVGIIYEADFLKAQSPLAPPESNEDEYHFSSIIGVGTNCQTGERLFLVRNTWGPGACKSAKSTRHEYVSGRHTGVLISELSARRTACNNTPECNARVTSLHDRLLETDGAEFHCTDDGYFVVPASSLESHLWGYTILK